MFWQINSWNGLLLNLAAASIWLSHVMHSAFVGAIEDLYVFHHLFANIILFVVVSDLC